MPTSGYANAQGSDFLGAGTDSTVLTIPVKALECSGADRGSAMSDLTDKAAVKCCGEVRSPLP